MADTLFAFVFMRPDELVAVFPPAPGGASVGRRCLVWRSGHEELLADSIGVRTEDELRARLGRPSEETVWLAVARTTG